MNTDFVGCFRWQIDASTIAGSVRPDNENRVSFCNDQRASLVVPAAVVFQVEERAAVAAGGADTETMAVTYSPLLDVHQIKYYCLVYLCVPYHRLSVSLNSHLEPA